MTNLSFGEVVILNDTLAGFVDVSPGGQISRSNAALIAGTQTPGSFTLTATPWIPIVITLVDAGFTCDATYLGPCTGTPTLTNLRHDFSGQVTENYCPARPRCQETVSVGGQFSFTGASEGRWLNTLTITVNYQ